MNLLELVEELEDLTETSSQIPLTGKVMIDRDELLEIINEMRNEIPTEVREAKQISTERDAIIDNAKKEADNIIQGARSHAEEIISQDELVLQANKRADEILKSSNEESTRIREGARDYADSLLENTQKNLADIIKTLNENRQELRG